MKDIIYKVLMGLLLLNMGIAIYAVATTVPPQRMCIDGVVMEKKGDMMVQSGLFATRCMPISVD
jgi:hypothetical protein